MNIEKIKNFSQDEQKTLNFFELLRNEIIIKDNELNEGIDFIFGRKFANKIDILLNLVITLEDKEELQKENEELKNKIMDKDLEIIGTEEYTKASMGEIIEQYYTANEDCIAKQRIKDIIDRIDYDIKKTKEIISKNTNISASYRKNDYQIVRLRAMNTKSLDIKKRLQELLEGDD